MTEIDESVVNKANEIMINGDPVEFILKNHKKLHVGDTALAKSLLVSVGCQSVLNSDGIHPKVSGESGKGKTHCCKSMAHLIPKEYMISSTLSDKAAYYMELKTASVVFCDDVNLSESMEGVIKRATSNYQQGDTYRTVDKDRKPKVLTIPRGVTWWLTSVDDDQSLQLLNRTFGGGIDESSQQDDEVFKFQIQQAASGELGFPESEDVEVCREIIRQIKRQPFIVKIPFAGGLVWEDKSNRRNLPIFLDIIKSFATLRFRQRPIVDGCLIADIKDYEDAKALYCSKAQSQTTKLTAVELNLCRTLHDIGESDTQTLQNNLKLSRSRIHNLIHGRKDRPESGLLFKVSGLKVERQSIKVGDVTTLKNYYSLDNFDGLSSYDNIVNLTEAARLDFYRCYNTVAPTVTNKINDCNHTVVSVIDNVIINSNTPDKSLSLSENSKTCDSGNSVAIDNDSRGNSAVTLPVIVAQHNSNGDKQKQKYIRVEVLKDIPLFMGADNMPYSLRLGDFTDVPEVNANSLIKRGVLRCC